MGRVRIGDRVWGDRLNGETVEGEYRGTVSEGEYRGFALLDNLNHRELTRVYVRGDSLRPVGASEAEAQLDLLCSNAITAPRTFSRSNSDSSQNPVISTAVGSCRNLLSESEHHATVTTIKSNSDSSQNPVISTAVGSCRNPTAATEHHLAEESPEPSDVNGCRKLSESDSSKNWHTVEEYQTKGRIYYRYRHGVGHSVEATLHIRGGQVSNARAIANADKVRRLISEGRSPSEIIPVIRSF